MRIAMGIEYDGSRFCGWQRQAHGRSVQGCVEQALSTVADHPVTVTCAGRTDAGVHALGQVIHFDSEAARSARAWVLGANVHLPDDVSMLWAQPVPEDFHARFSAQRRHYRYWIVERFTRPALARRRVCWQHQPLDEARMAQAAQYLIGEHDFQSFRALACQARDSVRRIEHLTVRRAGAWLAIDVVADGFLHHMVRNIAGVLIAIGRGERAPQWAQEVLAARDRAAAGVTAPAQGLYLAGVHYDARFGLPAAPAPEALGVAAGAVLLG